MSRAQDLIQLKQADAQKQFGQIFELFNEIGIIQQLSSAALSKHIPQNLHLSHFSVLTHLVRLGDGQTPKEITSAFQVTKGTMTNTLKDLTDRGFITLAPHETDGRSKVVFLTDNGRLFHKEAIQNLGPAMMTLLTEVDMELAVECLPALKHLRQVLDAKRED